MNDLVALRRPEFICSIVGFLIEPGDASVAYLTRLSREYQVRKPVVISNESVQIVSFVLLDCTKLIFKAE